MVVDPDVANGSSATFGWWLASDGRWYPPELHASALAVPAASTPVAVPTAGVWPGPSPEAGWWLASDYHWYPPELRADVLAASATSPAAESPGPGWWLASDYSWYPPEQRADAPPSSAAASPTPETTSLPAGWWAHHDAVAPAHAAAASAPPTVVEDAPTAQPAATPIAASATAPFITPFAPEPAPATATFITPLTPEPAPAMAAASASAPAAFEAASELPPSAVALVDSPELRWTETAPLHVAQGRQPVVAPPVPAYPRDGGPTQPDPLVHRPWTIRNEPAKPAPGHSHGVSSVLSDEETGRWLLVGGLGAVLVLVMSFLAWYHLGGGLLDRGASFSLVSPPFSGWRTAVPVLAGAAAAVAIIGLALWLATRWRPVYAWVLRLIAVALAVFTFLAVVNRTPNDPLAGVASAVASHPWVGAALLVSTVTSPGALAATLGWAAWLGVIGAVAVLASSLVLRSARSTR